MLQKIKIRNFQSLKDVTITLGKVTILKGASDVGKSAVLRALNAFFTNSFNVEYAHNGDLPCGIAIQKNNHVAFGRRTTKGVEYKFDATVYSKTAKKCPQDILDFLGIHPYQVDVDMSVFFHLQMQYDSPFLMKESAITVAKIIGRISNLNIVLMAMREMFSKQLELKQEVNFLYNKKKDLVRQQLEFNNFESYDKLFREAEALEEEISKEEDVCNIYEEVVTVGDSFNARTRKYKQDSKDLEFISSFFVLFEQEFNQIQELENLIYTLEELDNKKEKSFDFSIIPEMESFILLFEEESKISEVVALGTAFNVKVQAFKEHQRQAGDEQAAYEDLFKQFSKDRIICPYSSFDMQEVCKQHIFKK